MPMPKRTWDAATRKALLKRARELGYTEPTQADKDRAARLPQMVANDAAAAAACSGGEEAHYAHLDLNDECPWCGMAQS